jgi:endonuclease/exonuclease/phosphatase family metal-dependent hydrolase
LHQLASWSAACGGRTGVIDRTVQSLRRWRRRVSRSRLTARVLGRLSAEAGDEPGLILLQIDGLSRTQFEKGAAAGRLPFLRRMAERGDVDLVSFYSGCPSTTPAVQGEILFGQKHAVPAYQYLDRSSQRLVRMFDADVIHGVAQRLGKGGEPLLQGGASYSNIYAGGAAEARFCGETLEADKQRLLGNPFQTLALGAMYFFPIVRVMCWALLECVIALGDVLWGVFRGADVLSEVKFIASRVSVSIVLREYLRGAVKLSIEQGAPVIYANFLGYDEHAHKRGPDSWFAHWVLKGIDRSIADIVRAARRSPARDYEVVVFSDHGQEHARQYDHLHGRSIQEAVKEIVAASSDDLRAVWPQGPPQSRGREFNRRAGEILRRRKAPATSSSDSPLVDDVVVAALGPLGHIYFPSPLEADRLAAYAAQLVDRAAVPLVFYRDSEGVVWAHDRNGCRPLDERRAEVLGVDHPFLEEAAADISALFDNQDTGDLVISGWRSGEPPVSFVLENGAHGSIGSEETRGFALVPDGVPVRRRRSATGEEYFRGEDLYAAGRELLGRDDGQVAGNARRVRFVETAPAISTAGIDGVPSTFRVMTYNIHSCIGLDGRVRPDRVAHVIRRARADVIALQEVDCNRRRSRHADQARDLAEQLEMSHHYYAVFEAAEERYGLAIISRWPLTHIQSSHLTPVNHRLRSEARGALWVEINSPWGPLQVINTHFGLRQDERIEQARLLTGEQWVGRVPSDRPVVLCGDFNAGPASSAYKRIVASLRDVQAASPGHRPRPTFPSPLPLRRLDHVFVNGLLSVREVAVPRTSMAVVASDHLPLWADLTLAPVAREHITLWSERLSVDDLTTVGVHHLSGDV